jgi:putative acetyltransferase
MIQEIIIRNEQPGDEPAISDLTVEAFKALEVSMHTEQFVIESLREAGALTVSLVALLDCRIVGHIAFSPVSMSDGTAGWYGLGPVSVLPELQRQGIGKALIEKGLERIKALGARGCCLVGHPEYYRQFGFSNPEGLVIEGVPHEVFFAISFCGVIPPGSVAFHESFMARGTQG